jgi:hypothetical protein
MDLRLHLRVISRFRWLVIGGLLLAVVLTFFSYFKLELGNGVHVGYREDETFQSSETISLVSPTAIVGNNSNGIDTGYLTDLAGIYAKLINSDIIRTPVKHRVGPHINYSASLVVDSTAGSLPFLEIDGLATSGAKAVRITSAVSAAFLAYIRQNQQSLKPSRRINVQVVSAAADNVEVAKARSKTLPIVVFLLVLVATLGLAYVLENLRPRAESAEPGAAPVPTDITPVTPEIMPVQSNGDAPEREDDVDAVESPRLVGDAAAQERSRRRA